MKSASTRPRIAAHRAVTDVILHQRNLDDALAHLSRLSGQDRSFARMLVMTSLRHGIQIQSAMADHFLDDPGGLPDPVIITLILGMAQLFFMDTASHAAIDESVKLQKTVGPAKLSGLVNGVLRNAQRRGKDTLFDDPVAALPDWLGACLPADRQRDIAATILCPPPMDISPRDPGDDDLRHELSAMRLANNAWRVDRDQQSGPITDWPGFDDGQWWIQDAAARLPVLAAGDIAGKSLLDIGGAPGGKTMQAISLGASVTTLDPSENRVARLNENLSRMGMSADVVVSDLQSYTSDQQFDVVVLDAPCSAIGTLRRHPDMLYRKSAIDFDRYIRRQSTLLDHAISHVKPGGQLIYAVCSMHSGEGVDQFDDFLSRHAGQVKRWPITADEIAPHGDGAGLDEFISMITPKGDVVSMPDDVKNLGGIDGFFTGRCQTK